MRKFERVETPDYILAVSDEKVREDDLALIPGYVGIVVVGKIDDMPYSKPHRRWKGLTCDTCFDVDEIYKFQKIIAYQPKGDAPELDLPLLPEQPMRFSEDDMRKAFDRGVEVSIYLSDYKNDEMWNEFLKSLKKSKSPKFFIAETYTFPYLRLPEGNSEMVLDDSLSTTTNSEGKQVLKGHYL